MNKTSIMGNITRDIEIKNVGAQMKAVASFGIAVNKKFKDKESTMYIDVEAWDKTAELIEQYYKKGSPILFEGELQQDNWEDKNTGQKRSKHKLVVRELTFLPRGASADAPAPTQRAPAVPAHVPAADIDSEPPF